MYGILLVTQSPLFSYTESVWTFWPDASLKQNKAIHFYSTASFLFSSFQSSAFDTLLECLHSSVHFSEYIFISVCPVGPTMECLIRQPLQTDSECSECPTHVSTGSQILISSLAWFLLAILAC